VIAGRVVDEDGDPLTEVGIQAYEWRVSRGARSLQFARQAMVDDLGNFRIANQSCLVKPETAEVTTGDSGVDIEALVVPVQYFGLIGRFVEWL
jgi:hypothetical protein